MKWTACMTLAGMAVMLFILFCSAGKDQYVPIDPDRFRTTHDGKPVELYTLKNGKGMEVLVTNYGGKVVAIRVPDRDGNIGDVVLGFETGEATINGSASIGALIGRYANRIAFGRFTLDGKTYQLAVNNGPHHLHGGVKGYRKVVWDARQIDGRTLVLSYLSWDGEENYPGNLDIKVTYTVTEDNALKIDYFAITDKPTVLNLTNHSFFNLAGEGSGSILDHLLMIQADAFTPTDEFSIPTGEIRGVKGTVFDFTTLTRIGDRIDEPDEQLIFGKGYDHNYVLNKAGNEIALAARVVEPVSGRVMEVYTTEPGIQFYTGNSLTENDIGKGGHVYSARTAFCLETQHFPDSPNHPEFPSTVLRPGETFESTTLYKFSTR